MLFHETEHGKLFLGDCLDILPTLADNSIDSVVCDPPYELGFMGKHWDNTGIAYNTAMWKECLRVLKPGGYLLSFGGSRTYHRMACAIEDAGFEIRDMIEWMYGSGFPKSLNIGKAIDKMRGIEIKELPTVSMQDGTDVGNMSKNRRCGVCHKPISSGNPCQCDRIYKAQNEWQGYGTALKPAHEPICMARKPLSEKTVAENVLKWGTGGINIDGCRVGTMGRKTGTKNPEAQKGSGNCYTGSDGKRQMEYDQQTQSRFPANLIHDGSDEVLECFPQTNKQAMCKTDDKSGWQDSYVSGTIKSPVSRKLYLDDDNGGSASRFFYSAKSSKSERNKGLDNICTVKYDAFKSIGGVLWKDAYMELVELLQKVTSGLTLKWLTAECGESIMGLCQSDSLSTTLTGISKITTSQILPLLTHSLTNAFTQVVNSETVNGGNHVESVESLSQLKQSFTTEKVEYPLGVVNAVSQMLSIIRDAGNWKEQTNFHSTVKPIALMTYLCRLVTPKGGTVLDPFAGSGTTLVSAKKEGFRYIGIEMQPEYVEIIKARLESAKDDDQTTIDLS